MQRVFFDQQTTRGESVTQAAAEEKQIPYGNDNQSGQRSGDQEGHAFRDLILPSGEFDAYLFDLDGTVADSMPLHYKAWTRAITDAGGEFPEELFYAWGGVPIEKIVEQLNERYGLTMPVRETAHRKELLYVELLPELQPMASVVRVMEQMHGKVPFAIVSGSPRASIESTLAKLGLTDRFALLVGAEDYTSGKPDPEPFLTAAEKLGVAPERCLVFEDAEAGIRSAEAAGMQWVRVERR